MQFLLEYPLKLYKEVAENQGQWLETDQLTIQIPKQWDLDGKIINHKLLALGIREYRDSLAYDIPSILADHTTDLHYTAKYSFTKKPFFLETPPFSHKAYEYIFFKRKYQDNLLLDIIGLDKRESELQRKIAYLIQELLFESRYSEVGIKKQVEDAIENIFYQTLKKIIRRIGKKTYVDYESMYELTRQVVSSSNKFLSLDEIQSIVYKTIITDGLFPIYCEINTMNDSYFKLKLISLFTNSEILPWSPKFHASLALGNYHYSFTPNDLVNLRTLDSRTFHKGYHYIRIRILDFFPLDQWIEKIANYFIQHLPTILNYIKEKMPQTQTQQIAQPRKILQDDPLCNSGSSILQDFKELKEPFLREEQKETELISEKSELTRSFSGVVNCAGRFKQLLRTALKKVEFVRQVFGIEIHSPLIVKIKDEISNEFYQNYQSEFNRNGILKNFCSIITETEMRSYSTCANNCQTPVAAFIYHLCDTFRPFQEILHEKTTFLKQVNNFDFNIINYKSSLTQSKYHYFETNSVKLSDNLAVYCKFASIFDLNLLSHLFIQPAILEYSLDYFGFYSDEIFSHYLKSIRNVDFEPDKFQSQIHKQKKQIIFDNPKEQLFDDLEVMEFVEAYENSSKKKLQIPQDKSKLDQFILHLGTYQLEKIQYYNSQFNMHYLVQYFQNKLIQLKQVKKSVKFKHTIQDYLDTVNFFYFNSIRLQLVQKQRKNTLSQIGFVLAKDLDCVNKTEPTNIELQMQL